MKYCKHGMISECCSICNGFNKRKEVEYYQRKEKKSKQTAAYYQTESLKTADRFNEPVEDYELELFLEGTNEFTKDNLFLFGLAKLLGRSFKSMDWWYGIMYKAETFKESNLTKSNVKRFIAYRKERELALTK